MTPLRFCGTIPGMKVAVLAAVFSMSIPLAAEQAGGSRQPAGAPTSPDKIAEAYNQFLLGHRLEEKDDESGAIAAFKRAMELDPNAAEIPAELASVYLRQNKVQEAMSAAEQALKVAPANREANRVLGTIYAALSETTREDARPRAANRGDENLTKAIHHFELATDKSGGGEADPNVRATLARLYVRAAMYDKAIPLLTDLVNQEPGWQDGPMMLAEAYAGAGRAADAIAWLEQRTADDERMLPALADFYERERRWSDAAGAYARILRRTPRNIDVKTRYASALMNAGGKDNAAKARDALAEIVAARATEARPLYLLSQAQRRLGDFAAAEASARKLVALNRRSPWGYYALAEALEARHDYQAVVDEQALRHTGKADQGIALLEKAATTHADEPLAYISLAQAYADADRVAQAVKVLQDAQAKFPDNDSVAFELGTAYDKQKRFGDAEAAFRAVLARDPENAAALNYIGYMLAERGERLDESVNYLKKALQIEPDNGSYLDSLGWAYFKSEKLDLAAENLKRAADQLPANSVIQDHYGDVLTRLGRFDEAIAAYTRALNGDGDSIDKGEVDKKIRTAKQKL